MKTPLLALLVLVGCDMMPREAPESDAVVETPELRLTLEQYADTEVLWDAGGHTFRAPPGKVFVLASISLENLTAEDSLPAFPSAFEIETEEGERARTAPAQDVVPGACGIDAEVAMGATTRCGLVYEVLTADREAALLYSMDAENDPVRVEFGEAPKGPSPTPPAAPMPTCDTSEASRLCAPECLATCGACDCLATPVCSTQSLACIDALDRTLTACGC